jgi:hypothetical protein
LKTTKLKKYRYKSQENQEMVVSYQTIAKAEDSELIALALKV